MWKPQVLWSRSLDLLKCLFIRFPIYLLAALFVSCPFCCCHRTSKLLLRVCRRCKYPLPVTVHSHCFLAFLRFVSIPFPISHMLTFRCCWPRRCPELCTTGRNGHIHWQRHSRNVFDGGRRGGLSRSCDLPHRCRSACSFAEPLLLVVEGARNVTQDVTQSSVVPFSARRAVWCGDTVCLRFYVWNEPRLAALSWVLVLLYKQAESVSFLGW